MIQLNIKEAAEQIEFCLLAKKVAMLKGSPGIGKSAIINAVAKKYNLKVIDFRLAQCDPTDLNGFPHINELTGRGSYAPMETFPIKGDKKPEGYDGWLLFLDEMNSADRGVQKASYKLVLDKMVGMWELHPNVAMVAAGNLDTDNAIVEELSSALQSRLIHLTAKSCATTFLDYASEAGFDHRITDFLRFKPGNVNTFNPETQGAEPTYACERTWDFTNDIIKVVDPTDNRSLPILAGTIGEGVAVEFRSFVKLYDELPKMDKILQDPRGTKIPQEMGTLFALTGACAHNADQKTIDPLMQYVSRLPMEFQVVTLREIGRRNRAMLHSDPVKNWIATNNTELF